MKNTLTTYTEAVLAGASINSQAKIAGVAPNTLLRLLVKDPRYAEAKASGVVRPKGYEPVAQEKLTEAVNDIVGGLTAQEAAFKHGMATTTLTRAFHRMHPDTPLNRGGFGTPRSTDSRLERAQATVTRCRKALEKAEKDLVALTTPA